jgi:hypothetical protein
MFLFIKISDAFFFVKKYKYVWCYNFYHWSYFSIFFLTLLTTTFGTFGVINMGPILFRRNYFRNKEGAEQDIKDRIQNKIRQEEINVIRKGWLYIILIRKLRD